MVPTLETGKNDPARKSRIKRRETEERDRSHWSGVGAVLFVLGTILLIPLSLSSGIVPGIVGSLAALLLASGTVLVGTATGVRSV
jgi:hypothetical protein